MFIDERIFKEIESVEARMFDDYNSDIDWSDEFHDLLYELAEKELDDIREDLSEDEFQERTFEEAGNIINVYRFDADGLLRSTLFDYYGSHENMLKNIRSCVDRYSRDGYIYYVTGCGYDTISADLLGGSADGRAKYKFIAEINKDNKDQEKVKYYGRLAK